MDLLETIEDILEQKDSILPKKEKKIEFSFDEVMFSRMANFIINLDPDNLTDSQISDIMGIIEDLEVNADEFKPDEIEEGDRLAKRSTVGKNSYSKKWYRENKGMIKSKKERLERSSEGRRRSKNKKRLENQGKSPTGRNKVQYHVRKRSDRRD